PRSPPFPYTTLFRSSEIARQGDPRPTAPPEQHRCSPTGKRHQARTALAGGPIRGHAPKERRRRTRSDPTNPTRPQESGSGGEPPAGGLGGWAPQNNTDAHRPGSATRREQLPLVGEEGVEPSRPSGHTDLNRARLPFRHSPWQLKASTGVEGGCGRAPGRGAADVRLAQIRSVLPATRRCERRKIGWAASTGSNAVSRDWWAMPSRGSSVAASFPRKSCRRCSGKPKATSSSSRRS